MAITLSNIQQNHRGCYGEFTGDATTTTIPIPLTQHYGGQALTGVATVTTAPTSFTHRSGKGGFLFPHGTDQSIGSALVANGIMTITTNVAVGNGIKAY